MSTAFDALGGEPGIRQLVDRFYELMDTRPDASVIRAMHPEDLSESRDKLCWFLVGRLGGPPMYEERIGHPRLRARHSPFAIDTAAVDAWMGCMDQALEEHVSDPALRALLTKFLGEVARFMQNR